ncbi:MAG: hypothetical protein R3B83_04590 [Nitrospirales bacterium]|nr:hypothetical protein [Nitrospirales bacterium]
MCDNTRRVFGVPTKFGGKAAVFDLLHPTKVIDSSAFWMNADFPVSTASMAGSAKG